MDEDEDEPESATSQTSAPNFPLRRSSTTSSFGHQRVPASRRHGSETPSYDGNKSSSPALSAGATGTHTPAGLPFPDVSTVTTPSRPDWTFLPHELQFYLSYFYENITSFHYCAVADSDDFFRSMLLGLAIRNEALLYAVVGFSAYHHAMKNPNGRIHEFLQYYSRSVTLLLECLAKKEKYNVATLLTILQLATIEVSKPQNLRQATSREMLILWKRNTWATGSTSWATKRQPSKSLRSSSPRRPQCSHPWAA